MPPFSARSPRGLAVLWTLFILAACSLPGRSLPSVDLLAFDKLVHFALFAVFGLLWMRAFRNAGARPAVRVLALGLAYAVLTELYQGLLPFDRVPDPLDAAANAAGLTASVVLYLVLRKRGPASSLRE